MDGENDQKKFMSNRTNPQASSWNLKFLEKKKQALQEQKDKRKKQQDIIDKEVKKAPFIQPMIPNTVHNLPILSQALNQPLHYGSLTVQNRIEPEIYPKPLTSEQILAQGKILKIVEKTLTHDDFKVQCLYEDEVIELIASKQEIVRNNIIPLLDFYEKTLGLR